MDISEMSIEQLQQFAEDLKQQIDRVEDLKQQLVDAQKELKSKRREFMRKVTGEAITALQTVDPDFDFYQLAYLCSLLHRSEQRPRGSGVTMADPYDEFEFWRSQNANKEG